MMNGPGSERDEDFGRMLGGSQVGMNVVGTYPPKLSTRLTTFFGHLCNSKQDDRLKLSLQ